MCEGDYIHCYINMLLDEESNNYEEDINFGFDEKEFLKRGGDLTEDI